MHVCDVIRSARFENISDPLLEKTSALVECQDYEFGVEGQPSVPAESYGYHPI